MAQITATAVGEYVELRFGFDPALIAYVKAVPGARVMAGGYRIPRSSFPTLCAILDPATLKLESPELGDMLPPMPVAQTPQIKPLLDFAPRMPTWGQKNTTCGLTDQDYQAVGSWFLAGEPETLLLDEMGTGKTKQFIDAISYVYKHNGCNPMTVLVVAKASSVTNWRNEVEMFSEPADCLLLRGPPAVRWAKLNDNPTHRLRYVIVSWQTMRLDIETLGKRAWDWIVLDEAHLAKSTPLNGDQSAQARAIHALQAPRKTAMTGTLIINRPDDAWNILRWLHIEYRDWPTFERETCKTILYKPNKRATFKLKMVVGYHPAGLAKLRQMIAGSMLRRTKDEVMPNLPPYIRTDVEVSLNDEETKRYRAVEDELLLYLADNEHVQEIDLMTKALRLKQTISTIETFTGKEYPSTKLLTAESLIDDLIDSGAKVLVGTVFIPTVKALGRMIIRHKPAIVHGAIPMNQRDREVARFQNDPDCKVFIASAAACREAINLTAASAIIHIDKEWAQAYVDQFEARARRIGSEKHNGINVYSLMARTSNGEKTIDYGIAQLLAKKAQLAKAMVSST